jgi:hypothetical protein
LRDLNGILVWCFNVVVMLLNFLCVLVASLDLGGKTRIQRVWVLMVLKFL